MGVGGGDGGWGGGGGGRNFKTNGIIQIVRNWRETLAKRQG